MCSLTPKPKTKIPSCGIRISLSTGSQISAHRPRRASGTDWLKRKLTMRLSTLPSSYIIPAEPSRNAAAGHGTTLSAHRYKELPKALMVSSQRTFSCSCAIRQPDRTGYEAFYSESGADWYQSSGNTPTRRTNTESTAHAPTAQTSCAERKVCEKEPGDSGSWTRALPISAAAYPPGPSPEIPKHIGRTILGMQTLSTPYQM